MRFSCGQDKNNFTVNIYHIYNNLMVIVWMISESSINVEPNKQYRHLSNGTGIGGYSEAYTECGWRQMEIALIHWSFCWQHFEMHFITRGLLAYGYCHCLHLCVCVCICVCQFLRVCSIAHHSSKLGSPNLDQKMQSILLKIPIVFEAGHTVKIC